VASSTAGSLAAEVNVVLAPRILDKLPAFNIERRSGYLIA
jgi:hypothetical protein